MPLTPSKRNLPSRARSSPHPPRHRLFESLELRRLLSAAFDVTGLTALRNDPIYSSIDGSGVTVAVLDTGVFGSHPDLIGNFLGYVDTVVNRAASAPFVSSASQSRDPGGHGSHVAGTIASTNRNIGVANAAKFIGIRALTADGEARPRHDTVAEGLRWVLQNHRTYGIRVINMSLGRPDINQNSPTDDDQARVMQALEDQGITIVTANGNNYAAFRTPGASTPAVNSTIAVINTWEDTGIGDSFPSAGGAAGFGLYAGETGPRPDQIAASSQRSTLPNQVAAPGSTIFSTWNGEGGQFFNTIPGTSMASPFVAGVVALMQDAAQSFGGSYLTPNQVLTLIKQNGDLITDAPTTNNFVVDDNGNRFDLPETGLTFPRINAYRTIQAVRSLFTRSIPDADSTLANSIAVPAMDPGDGWVYNSRSIGFDGSQPIGSADVDLYKVTLTSAAIIDFKLTPSQGSPASRFAIRLFFTDGSPQGTVTDPSGFPDHFTVQLPAGAYYIGISGENNVNYNPINGSGAVASFTGNYNFTVTAESPDPDGGIGGTKEVELLAYTDYYTDTFNGYLQLNGNISSDTLPSGSSKFVGTADVDFYGFFAPDDGFVDIDLSRVSSNLDPYFEVYGENLTRLGWDDNSGPGTNAYLRIIVQRGKPYFIGVSSAEGSDFDPLNPTGGSAGFFASSGNYHLVLTFSNRDADGTALTTNEIYLTPNTSGSIGFDDGFLVGSDGTKDVDFYAASITENGRASISVTSSFESVITLYTLSPDKTTLLTLGSSTGTNHNLAVDATVGEAYWLSVTGKGNQDFDWFAIASGSGGATGNYTLNVSQIAINPTDDRFAGAINLPSSKSVNGNLGRDGSLLRSNPLSDVDLYRYTPTASGLSTFRLDGIGDLPPDTYLRIFNQSGIELAFNDDASDSTTNSLATLPVTAGQTYYIGISSYGDSPRSYNPINGTGLSTGDSVGDYNLRVSEQPFPSISIADTSANEGSPLTFTLSLSSSPLIPVTVNYTTRNGAALSGTHYQPLSGTLTFQPGQTSATLSVQTSADGLVDGNRSFFLDLSSPTNSSLARATANATLINIDLPDPTISISDASANEGSSLTFTISLSSVASKPVSFQYSTRNNSALAGTNYQPLSGTLTIPPGQTSATLTVQSSVDSIVDAGRSLFLDLSSPTNATFSRSTATAQINNTDVPPDGPDLFTEVFDAPTSLPPGSRRNTVELLVENKGNVRLNAPVQINFYASLDGNFDASDPLFFSTTQRLNLRVDAFRYIKYRFPSPTNIPDGNYRIIAIIDPNNAIAERSESNNLALAETSTSIIAPFIELSPQLISVPTTVKPNGRSFATVRITNTGNVPASGSALLNLLLSRSNPNATDGGQVGTLLRKLNLRPNQSINLRIPFRRPLDPGTVFLSSTLSFTGTLPDRNPNNNSAFSASPVLLT